MSGWRAAMVAACVGGLVLLAGWLIGRGGDGAEEAGTTVTGLGGDLPALACPAALDEVCGDLADRLGTTAIDFTPGSEPPAEAVILAPARDLPESSTPGEVVGRSPIVIVVWRERALVLRASCATSVDAACLASAFGRTWGELGGDDGWGSFKLGLADPSRSEAALAAWSVLASGGVPGGLADSLRLRAVDDGGLLLEMAQFGDSRADAAVATEVAVAAQLDNVLGRGGRFEVYYPDPGPWVEFVALGEGRDAQRLIGRLLESDMQEIIAAAGLRPVSGAALLPEELGDPGDAAPPLTEAQREALLEAWSGL
jgi:hypothetical protein